MLVPPDEPDRTIRINAHDNPVKGIAAAGGLIATNACWYQDTGVDQIRLWTTEGKPLGPVTLPENLVSLGFCAEGESLLALGRSGALWRAQLLGEYLIAAARRIAGRKLSEEEERNHGIDAWRAVRVAFGR
jgi:hypothetical protein